MNENVRANAALFLSRLITIDRPHVNQLHIDAAIRQAIALEMALDKIVVEGKATPVEDNADF